VEDVTKSHYNAEFVTDHGQTTRITNLSGIQVKEVIELKKEGRTFISSDIFGDITVIDLSKITTINFSKRHN